MEWVHKISLRAILTGGLVDVGGTYLWGLLIGAIVTSAYGLSPLPPDQLATQLDQIFQTDPVISGVNLVVGLLFSILGGYVAARAAKQDELLNGGMSGWLGVVLGIATLVTGEYSVPLWLLLVEIVLGPAWGVVGGWLRMKQVERMPKEKG